MEDITYYQKGNEWEWVYYQDATQTYPMHTHAKREKAWPKQLMPQGSVTRATLTVVFIRSSG